MPAGSPRLLVVEDDAPVRRLLELTLTDAGYHVQAEEDGKHFDEVLSHFRPDLTVLDAGLPGGPDGLALARRLRQASDIPILFVTGADALEDRLAGFEAGASDYLAKPFHPEELVARVRALLALAGRSISGVWQVGGILVDEGSRTVIAAGPPLDLTRTEFDVFVALARRPGRVVSKTELLTTVWGYEGYDAHLVEVHVSSLRRKLEAGGCQLIHTVRGVGYVVRP